MKKLLLSGSLILGLSIMVGSATYALFNAQDTIPGNTISAADAYLDGHNFRGNKPINSAAMVPGEWTPDGRAEIYNIGDIPLNVYMYADNVVGAACDKTNLWVATGYAGGNETANVLFNGPLAAITGAPNRFETTLTPPFDVLEPNITQVIHQKAQLDASAGNEYMETSCTWDEIVVGESIAPVEP